MQTVPYKVKIEPSFAFQGSSSSAYSGTVGSGALRLGFLSAGLECIICLPLGFDLEGLSGELSVNSIQSLSELSELELWMTRRERGVWVFRDEFLVFAGTFGLDGIWPLWRPSQRVLER
jgi:hypothetical protein